MTMTFRPATLGDCALLAELNQQLLEDEGHRNRGMTLPQLEERMRGWLTDEYRAVIFEDDETVVAYALYREQPDEVCLRQLFVTRDRRRQGVGRRAVEIFRSEIWPKDKRLTVSVLSRDRDTVAFWHAVGYQDYCLTLEIVPDGSTET